MQARLTATQATLEDRRSLMELTLGDGRVVYSSYAPEGNEVGINKAIEDYGIEEIFHEKGAFLVSFISSIKTKMTKES